MILRKMVTDAENKITVEFNLECNKVEFDRGKLEAMLRTVCLHFGCNEAEVTIAILDDKAICELNSKFLNSQTPTDVISFDTSQADSRCFDLAVNAEMAARQAQSRGHEAEAELALYVLHGLLHNLGFDDTETAKAEKMHKTEDDILQKSGYGVVYNC
jgi:probable rRNA maturation factor